jgi:hypothetical protein
MAETASESNHLAVCAIDFGTSLTGVAYSLSSDYNNINVLTKCTNRTYGEKIPTAVLLTKEKSFWKFGYEAQEEYSQICDDGMEDEYYYFDCFKMKLHHVKVFYSLINSSYAQLLRYCYPVCKSNERDDNDDDNDDNDNNINNN